MKQSLTNGILTYKYGFNNLIEMLQNQFISDDTSYENEFLKLKHINSVQLGIVRFDFIITDENVKKELYHVEETLIKTLQDKIYGVYTSEFTDKLLNFLKDEVEKVKEEMQTKNPNIEYVSDVSIATIFTYLKNSGILRLEILL